MNSVYLCCAQSLTAKSSNSDRRAEGKIASSLDANRCGGTLLGNDCMSHPAFCCLPSDLGFKTIIAIIEPILKR